MRKPLVIFSVSLLSSITVFCQDNKGWQKLFDGKTLNGWTRMDGKAEYKVEDGAIAGITVAGSPNTFLVSDKKFTGDFILEMEAKLEDSSMNSGIQFKSNYDSSRKRVYGYQYELDPSARKWSAGIYDESNRGWLYTGSLNSPTQKFFTTGVFHKVRIESIGNTIKTWLDGQPVAWLVDTLKTNQGLIALQVHSINRPELAGRKVHWKNIRIKTSGIVASSFPKGVYVVNLQPNTLATYEKQDGWKLLFDGKSSAGWKGAYRKAFPDSGWLANNGTLKVLSAEGREAANGGDIVTLEQFSAFDFSFEFKLTPGANSGIKYFVTLTENNPGSAIGLEYQLLDDKVHPDANMGRDGNRTLASLYDLIPAKKQDRFLRPIGQWNHGRIIVYPNNHVEHYLNGIKVLEYERASKDYRDLVAISKYKVWQNFGEAKEGRILLQDHGNEVSFRSLKIKKLK